MPERPVHLIVSDDQARNPLTVFFRLLLVIPHLIWLSLWGIAALLAVIANWFATLFAGQSPDGLHNFLAAYIRYAVHVGAYLFLVADPFPDFTGRPGYPVDVEIAPPQPQNRWSVAFRLILAIPAALFAAALASTGRVGSGFNFSTGLLGVAAFLGWFVCLARSRMPRGLRDAAAYALAYTAQLDAYLFLLTDRYPDANPFAALDEIPTRSDPIGLHADEHLERSRLTVFFRLLLVIPHLIWLFVWGILAFFAVIANWFATLIRGSSPPGLHDFLASYLRYAVHVYAYLYLTADPYPGFAGRVGSYPVEAGVAGPVRQNPWSVGFRIFLAIPALMIASAYNGAAAVAALLGWFAVLATGRMPRGLRSAQTLSLRYAAQTYGYLMLLSDSYPYSGPSLNPVPVTETPLEPSPVPAGI